MGCLTHIYTAVHQPYSTVVEHGEESPAPRTTVDGDDVAASAAHLSAVYAPS